MLLEVHPKIIFFKSNSLILHKHIVEKALQKQIKWNITELA